MPDSISGHVAIVTGAARGLGRGIAESLAEAGARVAVVDIDSSGAEAAAGQLSAQGHAAIALAVDVSDRAAVEEMVTDVLRKWGEIDILVNNAGINDSTPALELTDETWQRVLGVNLTGVLLCSQTAGRHMVEREYGRIINISSVSAHFGAPNLAAYAATKSGVLGLTRVMAVEWGAHGITVNAICPGNVETEMLRSVFEQRASLRGETTEEVFARIAGKTPAGRLGIPSDIGGMVTFLASPAAAYVTGQAINVCGGRTINLS